MENCMIILIGVENNLAEFNIHSWLKKKIRSWRQFTQPSKGYLQNTLLQPLDIIFKNYIFIVIYSSWVHPDKLRHARKLISVHDRPVFLSSFRHFSFLYSTFFHSSINLCLVLYVISSFPAPFLYFTRASAHERRHSAFKFLSLANFT